MSYNKAVLNFYRAELDKGNLSSNLVNPNPGWVREECIAVYKKRNEGVENTEALKLFFTDAEKKGYGFALDNSLADKFKQLPKILNGDVKNPNIKYIELIAWLIDFKPRPSTSYSRQNPTVPPNEEVKGADEGQISVPTNDEGVEIGNNPEGDNGGNAVLKKTNEGSIPIYRKWLRWIAIALGLFIVLGFIVSPRYMVWKGDHYEWLFFDNKKDRVVPIDWDLVLNFRMVKKDTLTKYSVGRVFYLKDNNNHEVFTMEGNHPVLVNRKLHTLTQRILDSIQVRVREEKIAQGLLAK